MFAGLETFLLQVARSADGSSQLQDIAVGLSNALVEAADATGSDWTSQMSVNLYKVSTISKGNGVFSVGVGKGGREGKRTTTGTISAFLRDHKQYYGPHAVGSPDKAWKFLSEEAKNVLALDRMQGRYGGVVGGSYYYSLQDEGDALVGIQPRHFVDAALSKLPELIDLQMQKVFKRA